MIALRRLQRLNPRSEISGEVTAESHNWSPTWRLAIRNRQKQSQESSNDRYYFWPTPNDYKITVMCEEDQQRVARPLPDQKAWDTLFGAKQFEKR
jgi:hypothetical protein